MMQQVIRIIAEVKINITDHVPFAHSNFQIEKSLAG
jgi:hypothetical protein